MRTRFLRVVCFSLFLSLAAPLLAQQFSQPLITQPINESQLTTLKGNTHPLAQPQFDIGIAPPNMPLNRMLLVLKRSPQQDFALRKMLDDQQDKASPNYHKWLTPDEFGMQYGPSDQDMQLVTGWLQSHGFQVNRVAHGRGVIEFSGVESQVEGAFHTQIHAYMVNGQQHWANASDPQIPAALAPAVAGVWSLHDFRKKPNIQISPITLKTKYTPGQRPDTTFNGGTLHALSPADFATIYHLSPGNLTAIYGEGVTIGVVGRSDLFSNGQDVFTFQGIFGPFCCTGVPVVLNGPDPGDLGGQEEAEATLDATWSNAIAPNATTRLVVSASTNTTDGVDLSELYIIDNNFSQIMTESFGSCEAFSSPTEAQAISTLAEQAAAQGITYMVSSDDSGAAGCDDPNLAPATHGASANVLASSFFNVAVGGTQFNEGNNPSLYWSSQNDPNNLGSALSYIPEDVWNESCSACQFPTLFSSGGGVSQYFTPKPSWQFGVPGIPNDSARDVPDVSLTAAAGHDPYILCLEGSCIPDQNGFISFALIGGTSASAPSFAGIMALVDEQYGSQGQANYVLYRLAAAETLSQCDASNTTTPPAPTCVFNDVTNGNNTVPGVQGFVAGTGYDLATGLGSVNVTNLVTSWNSIHFIGSSTSLSPASITATHGSPVTFNVTVSPTSGSGVPSGDVSLIAATNTINNGLTTGVGFLTLQNGSASSQVNNLPGGTYTLDANYAGDATFAPSPPSNQVNVTISPENSNTNLSVLDQNGNPFTGGPYGSFVYLRADVAAASGHGVPTGFLQFLDNTVPILGGPFGSSFWQLNSAGNTAAPNGIFSLAVGPNSVTASYGGDASFQQSTSLPTMVTMTQATTNTVVELVGGDNNGTYIAVLVNTTSGGNAPTGTVTLFSGGVPLSGPIAVTTTNPGTGFAQAGGFISSPISGNLTLTASYSGDANWHHFQQPASHC